MKKKLIFSEIVDKEAHNAGFKNATSFSDELTFDINKQYTHDLYVFVDGSEKIQTEYEWKKERFDLLSSILQNPNSETRDEWLNLDKWLKENKPENWVKCTRENMNVDDEVRHVISGSVRSVELFCKDEESVILYNREANRSFAIQKFGKYEINIAEKD